MEEWESWMGEQVFLIFKSFFITNVRKSLFASGIFFIFRQFTQNKIQEFPLKNKTIN